MEKETVFRTNPTANFAKIFLALGVFAALLGLFNKYLALISLPFFLVAVSGAIARKLIVYTLTDDFISSERGLVNKTTVSIPLSKIQNVRLTKNLFQRFMNVGDILLETAGESEPDHAEENEIYISDIDGPDQYYNLIMRKIGK